VRNERRIHEGRGFVGFFGPTRALK
jgi:hypothetical protein